MSCPHVAGLGALLKQTSPELVADGDQVGADDDRHRRARRPEHEPARIFRQGAGHVGRTARPIRASSSTAASTTGSRSCAERRRREPGHVQRSQAPGSRLDPSDLNLASIAIGDLAGSQTVKRRVTNVGKSTGDVQLRRHRAWPALTVSVSPSSFSISPR